MEFQRFNAIQLSQDIIDGGLKMTDVEIFACSLKVSWIKRCVTGEQKWQSLLCSMLGLPSLDVLLYFDSKSLLKLSKMISNSFWRDTLNAWSKYVVLHDKLGKNVIVTRPLIGLHVIENKNVIKMCKKLWDKGCKTINDLLDDSNRFLSHEEFCERYRVRFSQFDYVSLLRSIPKSWKNIISEGDKIGDPHLEFIDNLMEKIKVTSFVYSQFIKKRECTIKHQDKWSHTCDTDNWEEYYIMAFKATIDTKLRELQFRILNRYIPTNKWLYKRKLIQSETCDFCNNAIEDIEHLFWYCEKVSDIWLQLKNWLYPHLMLNNLCKEDVIFGYRSSNSGNILFNFIVLIAKKYILYCKWKKCEPSMIALQNIVKNYYETEYCIASGNDRKFKKFKLKWMSFACVFEK